MFRLCQDCVHPTIECIYDEPVGSVASVLLLVITGSGLLVFNHAACMVAGRFQGLASFRVAEI